MRPFARFLTVGSLLLWACGDSTGDDGSSPTTTGAPTSTGTTTSPTTVSSMDDSDGPGTAAGSSDTTPPTTGTTANTTTATTTADTTDSDESGSADTNAACPPPPPAGNECLECVNANCCAAWTACYGDEACECVVDCHVIEGGSLGMCSNACNLDNDLYQALYFCGQANCLGSCDWDCC